MPDKYYKQLLKTKLIPIGATLLPKFIAVFCGLALSRWLNLLPTAEFSQFNVTVKNLAIVAPFLTLALPIYTHKFYTIHRDNYLQVSAVVSNFWTTFSIIKVFLFFVGFLIIWLITILVPNQNQAVWLGLFVLQSVLITDQGYRAICDSFNKSWQFSITDLISKLVQICLLIGSLYLFAIQPNFNIYFWISLLAYLISLLLDAIWQRQYTPPGKFDLNLIQKYLPSILQLSLSAFIVGLYLNLDIPLLKYLNFNDSAINGYSNAYKLYETVGIIPGIISPILASQAFGAIKNEPGKIYKWLAAIFGYSLVLLVGFNFFGPIVIKIIDSQQQYVSYSNSVLGILGFSFIFLALGQFLGSINIFLGGEKFDLIGSIPTAFFAILMYYYGISNFGLAGAAAASVGVYALDFCFKLFFFIKFLSRKQFT